MSNEVQLSPELVERIAAVLDETAAQVRRAPVEVPNPAAFGGSRRAESLGRHAQLARAIMTEALLELNAHLRLTGDQLREHVHRLQTVDEVSSADLQPLQAGVEAVEARRSSTDWVAG